MSNYKNLPYSCMAPMISLSLRNGNNISICANSSWTMRLTEKIKLSEVLNLPALQSYRNLEHIQVAEAPKTCRVCIERNKLGIRAQRNYFNELGQEAQMGSQLHPEDIKILDINLTNICNLKCRMCSNLRSSSWFDDQEKISKRLSFIDPPKRSELSLIDFDIEKFTELKFVILKGGEPLFDKSAIHFLDKLIDSGLSEKISVTIFTNGISVKDRMNQLKRFKKINLIFSFEGTGDLYSYIRGGAGANFQQFHENVVAASNFENIFVSFMYTPQAYNILDWVKAYEYIFEDVQPLLRNKLDLHDLKSIFGNILHEPEYLAVDVLPLSIRTEALNLMRSSSLYEASFWKPLEELLQRPQQVTSYDKFIQYTKCLDSIRNENMFLAIPQFKKTSIFEDYQNSKP
jgi:pyruvate-formate lyase-activating enzyme